MKLKLVTNEKIQGDGFKAVWQQNCGGVYEVSEFAKYIKSPNYPGLYQANSYCNYTLIAPNDQEIIVDFLSFELEGNIFEMILITLILKSTILFYYFL